jgi:predicted metal-dependent hydrolase
MNTYTQEYEKKNTHYLTTRIPFWEEMHALEDLWQMDDLMDLETLSAATRMLALEIEQPMREEALPFVSDQIE